MKKQGVLSTLKVRKVAPMDEDLRALYRGVFHLGMGLGVGYAGGILAKTVTKKLLSREVAQTTSEESSEQ